MPQRTKRPLVIFDLDGTLYRFREGSFKRSRLRRAILKRAEDYIATKLNISGREAGEVLKKITAEWKEHISISLEKRYGLSRYEYFNTVWNLPAKPFIKKDSFLLGVLRELAKRYDFALVSDAPLVWIRNVLKELRVGSFFKGRVFSGESDVRKAFGNAIQIVAKKLKKNSRQCIVVGDQEETDIIPAKRYGATTVLVSVRPRKFSKADYVIRGINELPMVLRRIRDNTHAH